MAGHTPGPWKWGPNEYDNLEPDILGVAGAGYGDEHVVASEADKALIAAAPELLAACEAHAAVAEHGKMCQMCIAMAGDALCNEALDLYSIARKLTGAAIAKAKGD